MGRGGYYGGSSIWGPSDFWSWSSSRETYPSKMKGAMERDPDAFLKERQREIEERKHEIEEAKRRAEAGKKRGVHNRRRLRQLAKERRAKLAAEKAKTDAAFQALWATGLVALNGDGRLVLQGQLGDTV